jgi:hypothetical protein
VLQDLQTGHLGVGLVGGCLFPAPLMKLRTLKRYVDHKTSNVEVAWISIAEVKKG